MRRRSEGGIPPEFRLQPAIVVVFVVEFQRQKQQHPCTAAGADRTQRVQTVARQGQDRGYLSFDEINEGLPTDVTTVPQVEDALALLSEADVEIVDDATKMADKDGGNREPRAALVESTETSEEMDYAEFSKGNDPVRMYLRKMGSGQLADSRWRSRNRQAHRRR